MTRTSALAALVFTASWLTSAAAHAHIELTAPARRDAPDIKLGPCGGTGGVNSAPTTRTTNAARITRLRAGQKLTVTWRETIDHPGHYRIAFDADGQDDLVDPRAFDDILSAPSGPVLLDGIADQAGGTYSVEVTLPDLNCERCTLQLIQVMTDKGPVWGDNDVYYECADLVLEGATPGSAGSAGTAGSGGRSGSAGAAHSGSGGGTATAGAGGTGGAPNAGTAGSALDVAADDERGGCTLVTRVPTSGGFGVFAALALAWRARRRMRGPTHASRR